MTATHVTAQFSLWATSISWILGILLCSPHAFSADFTGQVVSVIDGDTIEVPHNQNPERIRLSGIDCPEKGQTYGKRAKQATSDLVFGKDVTIGHTVRTSTVAPLLMCSYRMARTSITRWSKTAGAGGIGSMHWKTQRWSN